MIILSQGDLYVDDSKTHDYREKAEFVHVKMHWK